MKFNGKTVETLDRDVVMEHAMNYRKQFKQYEASICVWDARCKNGERLIMIEADTVDELKDVIESYYTLYGDRISRKAQGYTDRWNNKFALL